MWAYIDSKIDILKDREIILEDCNSPSGVAMTDIICALSESPHNRLPSHLSAVGRHLVNTDSLFDGLPFAAEVAEDVNSLTLIDALKNRNICAAILARKFMSDTGRKITDLWKILDMVGVDTFLGKKWYKDLKNLKEVFLVYTIPILYYCGVANTQSNNIIITKNWMDVFKVNFTSTIEFDNYVYDMHTLKGRMCGKDGKEFAKKGSQVTNEYFIKDGKQLRNFYERCKIYEVCGLQEPKSKSPSKSPTKSPTKYKLESDIFKFIIRAQLVCGSGKTDTYFAEKMTENGRLKVVFVKGPFKSEEEPDEVIKIYKFKKLLLLPAIKVEKIHLIPDLLTNPLGVRNKILPNTPYPFLIFESMFPPNTKFPVEIRESKLWPPTEVVDWKNVKNCDAFNAVYATEQQKKEYVRALLFRKFIGNGDLADRNFILKDDIVYSIDEDSTGKDVNFDSIKSGKNKEIINTMMKKYYKEYTEDVKIWKKIANENITLLGDKLLEFINNN